MLLASVVNFGATISNVGKGCNLALKKGNSKFTFNPLLLRFFVSNVSSNAVK